MAIDAVIAQRWRSGRHVGPAKPRQTVRIQRGLMDREHSDFRFLDGSRESFGKILGTGHGDPARSDVWHAFWRSTGDWIDVPNVSEVQIEGGFDDNGIGHATIRIENVLFKQAAGVAGIYHLIQRGGLSPTLGFAAVGRVLYGAPSNEWYDVLNGGYRVVIRQGYGDRTPKTFTGLIDETDVQVLPDTITITCRSFGQLLADQRVFGSNKAVEIRSPITFADRLKTLKATKVSAGAKSSSSDPGHPATAISRIDDAYWLSHPHTTPDNHEWIEIHVPKGVYEDFYIDPHYDGMECFISVYARGKGLGHKAKVDGDEIDDGWAFVGAGMVPGEDGVPYIRRIASLHGHNKGLIHKFTHTLELGDNSVIRLTFRNLQQSNDGQYRAGVRRLVAYRQPIKLDARRKHWILVDDASEIVKWAFMWAGFHEWEVESLGARLDDPMVFHQSNFLIDIVNRAKEQGDYVFFIDAPTEADDSIGVPVFRHSAALTAGAAIEVRDRDTITGLQTKFSKESLSYITRFRGRETKKGEAGGTELGEETVKRVAATYLPPWSGAHHSVLTGKYDPRFAGRLAGVRKHRVHTDRTLATSDECMMAAILASLQEALAAWTATIEIPGLPGLALDAKVSVLDEASGTNTRVWLASLNSTFTVSPDGGSYVMSLGGSQIDVADMQAVMHDYVALAGRVNRGE